MLAGVAIVFANVVGRYVFGRAIFWAEEVLVFLVVWGVRGDGRDRLQRRPPEHGPLRPSTAGAGSVLNGLTTAVLLATCLFVIVQSWQVVTLWRSRAR